jgi:hypothetical protein
LEAQKVLMGEFEGDMGRRVGEIERDVGSKVRSLFFFGCDLLE